MGWNNKTIVHGPDALFRILRIKIQSNKIKLPDKAKSIWTPRNEYRDDDDDDEESSKREENPLFWILSGSFFLFVESV